MEYSSRAYTGPADLLPMADLANRYPSAHLRRTDLPYRFSSWALDDPENGRLWFTADGRLAAWAVMQSPWWTVDIACTPGEEDALLPEVLAWVGERARALKGTIYELPCWFVDAFADQDTRIRCLDAAGYLSQANVGEDSWTKVFMERSADLPVKEYRIPAGFTVRPLAGEAEVEAYVELQRAVFGTKNMTVAWRARTLRHPDYLPNLDLVVAAPDGRLAAFCICWLNRHGEQISGQVEPLGCHEDFRRYALGRVVLAEGLRRLRDCGAEKIYVETDNYRNTALRLYESVGFRTIRDVWMFRKDVD